MSNVKRYFHDSSDDEGESKQSRDHKKPKIDEETEDASASAASTSASAGALPQMQRQKEEQIDTRVSFVLVETKVKTGDDDINNNDEDEVKEPPGDDDGADPAAAATLPQMPQKQAQIDDNHVLFSEDQEEQVLVQVDNDEDAGPTEDGAASAFVTATIPQMPQKQEQIDDNHVPLQEQQEEQVVPVDDDEDTDLALQWDYPGATYAICCSKCR